MSVPGADRLARQHQRDLATITAGVTSVVANTALGADPSDIATWYWGVVDGLLVRVQVGYAQARRSSVDYLRKHAAMNGVDLRPVPSSFNAQQARTSLRVTGPVAFKRAIAAGLDDEQAIRSMATQMSGSAQRLTLQGDRDTFESTLLSGEGIVGWRRRLAGKGCGFCSMLASRGAVYVSRKSATTAKDGLRYHDHCRCWPEPMYEHESEPPEVRTLQRQWDRITAGESGKDAARAWRNHWENRATAVGRARMGLAAAQPSGLEAPGGAALAVRPVFASARSVPDLKGAIRAEMRRITGRDLLVQLPDTASLSTWREYAEGLARAAERFPDVRLREISWFNQPGTHYAQAGGQVVSFNAAWSSIEARAKLLRALKGDVSGWDGGRHGWSTRSGGSPLSVAVHEFGHLLDLDYLGERVQGQVLRLVERRSAAANMAADDFVAREISVYATSDARELVAEAFADVMLRGEAASVLSRDIFGLIEVEYRKGVTAAASSATAPARATAGGMNALTVPQLRALAKERGITVPAGAKKADLVRLLDEGPPPVGAAPAMGQMSVAELRAYARSLDVDVPAGAARADIISAVNRRIVVTDRLAKAEAAQLSSLAQQIENGASARAITHRARASMRALRLEPVGADGKVLTGTTGRAAGYVWRRPGGDVRLDGAAPAGFDAIERLEFASAQRMDRVALDAEHGRPLTRLQASPAAHTMTRGQADDWAAGSKIPFDLQHGTTPESAKSIAQSGFDIERLGTKTDGGNLGAGFYLNPVGAPSYGKARGYGATLTVRARVDKVMLTSSRDYARARAVEDYIDVLHSQGNDAARRYLDARVIPSTVDGRFAPPQGTTNADLIGTISDKQVARYLALRREGKPSGFVLRERALDEGYDAIIWDMPGTVIPGFPVRDGATWFEVNILRASDVVVIEPSSIKFPRGSLPPGVLRRSDAALRDLSGQARTAARQAEIDAARAYSDLARRLDEMVDNAGTQRALLHAINSAGRKGSIAEVDLLRLRDAVTRPAELRTIARSMAGREGVDLGDLTGVRLTFDRSRHEPIGADILDGADIIVVRPGATLHLGDEVIQLERAAVRVDTEAAALRAAQARQASVDDARKVSAVLAELDELAENGASKAVLRERLDVAVKRLGTPPPVVAALRKAIDGTPATLRKALGAQARKAGLDPTDAAGMITRFDPKVHKAAPGATLKAGDVIAVVRPGHTLRLGDEAVQLDKAIVKTWSRDDALAAARKVLAGKPTAAALAKAGITKTAAPSTRLVSYDPAKHQLPDGVTLAKGAKVRVTEPGYTVTVGGETVVVRKATAEVVEAPVKVPAPRRSAALADVSKAAGTSKPRRGIVQGRNLVNNDDAIRRAYEAGLQDGTWGPSGAGAGAQGGGRFIPDEGGYQAHLSLARELGFDGLPRVVTDLDEWSRMEAAGYTPLYRAWGWGTDRKGTDLARQYLEGPLHVGGGFGAGTNMSNDIATALFYAEKIRYERIPDSALVGFLLHPKAKVASYPKIVAERDAYLAKLPAGPAATARRALFEDVGTFAMARGYDAMVVRQGESTLLRKPGIEEWVIFNRTKIVALGKMS
jgi:hypothetical protein